MAPIAPAPNSSPETSNRRRPAATGVGAVTAPPASVDGLPHAARPDLPGNAATGQLSAPAGDRGIRPADPTHSWLTSRAEPGVRTVSQEHASCPGARSTHRLAVPGRGKMVG